MKKKKITLKVTLEFSGPVTEKKVMDNVMNSLIETAGKGFIAPEQEEEYTKNIKVSNGKKALTHKI